MIIGIKNGMQWGGERPKVDKHLLADNEAEIANNAMLIEGTLQAWRAPLLKSALAGSSVVSIFKFDENGNSHWVQSVNDLDVVKSPIVNEIFGRVYFTGESEPRFFANDNISNPAFNQNTDYIKLGVPAPTTVPTVGSSGGGTGYKACFYQYVNRYGEEGPNSPIGSISNYLSGVITMTGIAAAPTGRAIDKIRVFRSNVSTAGVGAFQFSLEATWFNTTTAYSIGQFVVYSQTLYKCTSTHAAGAWNASHFTAGDDVADSALGAVFTAATYDPPPAGLKGLKLLPNGVAYGFNGKNLCLCEPFKIHAWPTDYIIPMTSNIVAADHYGNTIAVIPADGYPVRVFGSHPSSMSKVRVSHHLPCQSKRGLGVYRDSVFYPSGKGFAMINSSDAKIVTGDLISERAWENYAPTAIHGNFFKGKYFGFNVSGGFVIDFDNDKLTRLGLVVHAGYVDSDSFYIAMSEADASLSIYEWEGDLTNYLLYTWTSREYRLSYPVNFAYGVIDIRPEFYTNIVGSIDFLALNQAIFAGRIGGSRGDNIRGGMARGRDDLHLLSGYKISDSVSFKLYVDGELKHVEVVKESRTIFPLPADYEGERVQYVVTGYIPTISAVIATSIEELMQ